jgi:acetyltransferase-like isoleucine patch superfamily enzyme
MIQSAEMNGEHRAQGESSGATVRNPELPGWRKSLRRLRDQARNYRASLLFAQKHIRPAPEIIARMPALEISKGSSLRFGEHCKVWSSRLVTVFYANNRSSIVIGNKVSINQGVLLVADKGATITIEDHVRIGPEAQLVTTAYHQVCPGERIKTANIVIGRNALIGRRANILPGITVGMHAVVGSCSVVTKDVPPRTFVAGNPAVIKKVFGCPDDWIRDSESQVIPAAQ